MKISIYIFLLVSLLMLASCGLGKSGTDGSSNDVNTGVSSDSPGVLDVTPIIKQPSEGLN